MVQEKEPGLGLCLQWRYEGSSHLLVSEPILSQPCKFSSSKVHVTEGQCCTWVVTYCVWKEPKDRDGHDSGAGKYKTNALALHPKVCLCTSLVQKWEGNWFGGSLLFWGISVNYCLLSSVPALLFCLAAVIRHHVGVCRKGWRKHQVQQLAP